MKVGPPLTASEITETGWYYLQRCGAPRGYMYIASDPDNNLWMNFAGIGKSIRLAPEFCGTFYKLPDDPLETDDPVVF